VFLAYQHCTCQQANSAVFTLFTSQFMSPVDASDSGEEFGPTPPGSSEEDHEADTKFQPMADTWTIEQLNVLLL
jgi:hypothetical protein